MFSCRSQVVRVRTVERWSPLVICGCAKKIRVRTKKRKKEKTLSDKEKEKEKKVRGDQVCWCVNLVCASADSD